MTKDRPMTKLLGRSRGEIIGSIIAAIAVAYGFAILFGLVR